MSRMFSILTFLIAISGCSEPFTYMADDSGTTGMETTGVGSSSGETSEGSTGDTTRGSSGTTTEGSTSGATEGSTGGSVSSSGSTGNGMDLPPGGPYELCEGPWDSYIITNECETANCAVEYFAQNPDGSGRTSIGFYSPGFQVKDPNPINGQILVKKQTQDPYGSDLYMLDWMNGGAEVPLANEPMVSEAAGEWNHQGNQVSLLRSDELNPKARCWRILTDQSNYTEIVQNSTDEFPSSLCTWSPDSTEVMFRSGFQGAVWKLPITGGQLDEVVDPFAVFVSGSPRWSSENLIAMQAKLQNAGSIIQVWTMNPDGSDLKAITDFTEGATGTVDWSPDGMRLVTVEQKDVDPDPNSTQIVGFRVVTMDPDGSNQETVVEDETISHGVIGWGGCPG